MMRTVIGAWMLVAALPAFAESAYVTDRFSAPLRAAVVEGGAVIKSLDSGAALEVLERADKYARVRDAQGAEGWIEVRYLSNAPPARAQLERAQLATGKLEKELSEAQLRIKQLEAAVAQESARGAELSKAVEQNKAEAVSPPPAVPGNPDESDFPWGWLVLAFAMLGLGFGAGVVWLRERHRKKLGGMYLRI